MDVAWSFGEPYVAVAHNEGRTQVICVTNLSRVKAGLPPAAILDILDQIKDYQLTLLNITALPLTFNKGEQLTPEYIADRMGVGLAIAQDLAEFLNTPSRSGYFFED